MKKFLFVVLYDDSSLARFFVSSSSDVDAYKCLFASFDLHLDGKSIDTISLFPYP